LNGIKALIFDLDGVILESANIKTEAFLELFAEYPQHHPAILRYHFENLGVSRYQKFEWIYRELLGRELSEAERKRLGTAFSTIVLDKILNCPFVPGAQELLQALPGRSLAFIASGTPQEELELILQRRGVAQYFAGVWGTPLDKSEIIGIILARHGLKQSQAVFVGYGISDYQAAAQAGILFIARETPELQQQWQALDVMCVPDLAHLATWLAPSQ
jgi:phosphoglycolate phosphatase-like HAD superfamily hydrolase